MEQMSKEQLEEILASAMAKAMDARDRIDHETHKADHEWVAIQRERERKWNESIEKAKLSLIGAAAVAFVAGVIKMFAFIGALVLAGISAKTGGH